MASLVPILFAPADAEFFRTQGKKLGAAALHREARTELERQIRVGPEDAGDKDPSERVMFQWQPYVAMHPQSVALVGPGITSFEGNFIAGTTDPNGPANSALTSSSDT